MSGLLSSFISTEDETRSKFFFFKCASNYFYLTLLCKGFSSTFLGIVTAVTITNFFAEPLSDLLHWRLSILSVRIPLYFIYLCCTACQTILEIL